MWGHRQVWGWPVVAAAVLLGVAGCGKSGSTSGVQGLVASGALSSTTAAPATTGAASGATGSAAAVTGGGSAGASSVKASPTHRKSATAKASVQVASTASGSAKPCPGSDVSAMISGVHKCLQNGQECQSKAVAQYTAYGFDCIQSGTRYVLKKRA